MARRKRKRKTHIPPRTKRSRVKSLLFFIAIIFSLIFAVSCRTPVVESGYDNLTLGVPGPADTIIEREGYALGYIEKHEQPAWVQYVLTADEVSHATVNRSDDFRADPYVPTGSATPQDYTRSGYDRGHLAPAADMGYSDRTMSESFYMSNMSPQNPQFNRGIWSKLEKLVRHFASSEKRIVVVTGPILPVEKNVTIGHYCPVKVLGCD